MLEDKLLRFTLKLLDVGYYGCGIAILARCWF